MTSLTEALAGHRNSLGLVRLVLAAAVIFHHSFVVGGYFATDPVAQFTHDQLTIGSLAVGGFFTISGYLITKSGQSLDVVQFIWHRALRILPAFWAVLLVTAFIVGPLVWVASGNQLQDYLNRNMQGPVGYVMGNGLLRIQNYGIFDLFQSTTPYGLATGSSVMNGSLWTLFFEWMCYMAIAVLVLLGLLKRARIILPICAVALAVVQAVNIVAPGFMAGRLIVGDSLLVPLAFAFLVGAGMAAYGRNVPFDGRIAAVLFIAALVSLALGWFSVLGPVAIGYLCLWLAARLPAGFQKVGSTNDYSYGVYIYGFLVQQILAFAGVNRWGYLPYTVLALLASLGLAWLSWHLIEKRALQLKNRGPGRGMRYWYDRARRRHPGSAAPA